MIAVEVQDHDPTDNSAASDLELLARWAVRFYGRAAPLSATISSTLDPVPREDDRMREFHRAATIHRRFERLRSGRGCLHYAVLWWCYVERGPEDRVRWTSVMGELGWRFARPEQRKRWTEKRKSVRSAAPTRYGERLHDEAVRAYENLRRIA